MSSARRAAMAASEWRGGSATRPPARTPAARVAGSQRRAARAARGGVWGVGVRPARCETAADDSGAAGRGCSGRGTGRTAGSSVDGVCCRSSSSRSDRALRSAAVMSWNACSSSSYSRRSMCSSDADMHGALACVVDARVWSAAKRRCSCACRTYTLSVYASDGNAGSVRYASGVSGGAGRARYGTVNCSAASGPCGGVSEMRASMARSKSRSGSCHTWYGKRRATTSSASRNGVVVSGRSVRS